MDAAVVVEMDRQQRVQPLAGLALGDDELHRFVGERRVAREVGHKVPSHKGEG